MKIVNMVQLSTHRWQLESQSGAVLQTDILVHDKSDAAKYAELYISSFPNWEYRLFPMTLANKAKVIKK